VQVKIQNSADIVAARQLYEFAFDRGQMQAAVALGRTYDPVTFEKLKVRGLSPNPQLALEWYEKAEKAGIKSEARHVILEAAHGYTANVTLKDALVAPAMITYRLNGKPLALQHGAPVRALIPDLYFWKSSKWITGIRFVKDDRPGYWEVRGYHNHADPWKEERYG
jgi:TPR repeat protein